MKKALRPAILFTLLACMAMPAASKPVYKWVDERGVVNYTTEPPLKSEAGAVATVAPKISSFDPVVAGLDAASQQRRNRDYLRERADRLQSELTSLRYARQGQPGAAEEAKRRRLEECQRQRRVDCDTYDDGGFPPRYVIGARPLLTGAVFASVPAQAARPARVRTPRSAMLR